MPSPTHNTLLVGLAGQQNAGKSTIFNMLTGANQHVANYPGVTVDKKSGSYRDAAGKVEVVDLPGTYGFSSFSLEERVARDFLLHERPDVLVNVVDASSLQRSLHFTFQLLEMGFPVVMALNMVDVAAARGITLDTATLAQALDIPVIPTIGRKAQGKDALRHAIRHATRVSQRTCHYEALEPSIAQLEQTLHIAGTLTRIAPPRWFALKLLEHDSEVTALVHQHHQHGEQIIAQATAAAALFETSHHVTPSDYMIACRDRLAKEIVAQCCERALSSSSNTPHQSLSARIDRVLLNRAFAPLFLVATVYLIYELSIVQGYKLTFLTWPLLAEMRAIIASWLPDPGLLQDTLVRSFSLWMVDSVNTLLNYIPVFLILFALIAILEDSGYMARIAFILDRIFQSFGLHGQSTLPFILGGVFTGGCAVPGIMATKGIPDERSRLATILTVPYMNCLAKIPLYTLLVNVYFAAHASYVMMFLSTITIIMAMIVAKILTLTILRHHETAPFVMEMPNYHVPTVLGVLRRAVDRTWVYVKKVGTIVAAVAVCVFVLLQFPGIPQERMAELDASMSRAIATFQEQLHGTAYQESFRDDAAVLQLLNAATTYREAKLAASSQEASAAIDTRFEARYPEIFPLLRARDSETRTIGRHLRTLANERASLRTMIREETILNSYFGSVGRALEPITQFAGFDWKVNIALISSFAARESSVATLGVLFQEGASENISLEERMSRESDTTGSTPLHALALMIFFVLYPPCLATTIMVKIQTGSYRWMLFSIIFPTLFGLSVASGVFMLGNWFDLSGLAAMGWFYALALGTALALAIIKNPIQGAK